MKVKFYINTGFAGCKHTDIVDLPDDTNEEELEMSMQEFLGNRIDYGFIILDPTEKEE